MNDKFIKERDKLISDILNSRLYQTYKSIDQDLYNQTELVELNIRKDRVCTLLEKYDENNDSLLSEIRTIQNEINELPSVRDYYRLREKLKEIIRPVNDEILKEIF